MAVDISYIRKGLPLTWRQRLHLLLSLSLPAMLAQISSIVVQYIDASMVGHLGADASASIGLVSTSLWLFWGICSAMTSGYSVQVAHRIGAGDNEGARRVFRQGIVAALIFSAIIAIIGIAISGVLPHWLGGTEAINSQASLYFLIFVAALPLLTLNYLAGGVLRCAGNMKVPSLWSAMMCVLDAVLNYLFIFVFDLGVLGAALGTVGAEAICAGVLMYYACFRQPEVAIARHKGSYRLTADMTAKAAKISTPMTLEHAVICGAQIAITTIVAPLGVVAIAANSFAVTAESLCYMPGYGIADAATALVGQSHGAKKPKLVEQFAYMSVGVGMAVMTIMGALMYVFAPEIMELITPVEAISQLGADVLRIEAWAEPFFAASIVAYSVFVGIGQTVIPAAMNFGSIWLVRVPLAWFLARTMGLQGVWLAMCIELTFRGIIFLLHLLSIRKRSSSAEQSGKTA